MLLLEERPLGAIVLDIEGTTTDIAFVKNTLFPYATERLETFMAEIAPTAEGQAILAQVRAETGNADLSVEDCIAQLLAWAKADQKITPLKALQGMIWDEGYRTKAYYSHVYDDAAAHIQEWHRRGVPLYIYSSGSIAAQKLLFAHTIVGDLTPCFQGYFDTTTGAKVDATSYDKIANTLGIASEELLFLSDHPGELAAAQQAGWQVYAVQRPGTPDFTPDLPTIRHFGELQIHFDNA
ncbi:MULTISPECIES: acireductone synthase [Cyanophyceae]|uniref:acireductone synthase n=1 Tax=Cyanophyceae TaxID=3028117 RepID=UPI001683871B|nr:MULTISPECIES: acireductone synthase [Cyanophyceae]MBD1916159.1 acireductone synthase [Phormidium sp. FACHB-77]MBD2031572.1 acireductone synthase [Phormidium sp. FACHB-322]MBD2052801.1 acireductone synthase [Leptolyngbya sp. FACHB-60]